MQRGTAGSSGAAQPSYTTWRRTSVHPAPGHSTLAICGPALGTWTPARPSLARPLGRGHRTLCPSGSGTSLARIAHRIPRPPSTARLHSASASVANTRRMRSTQRDPCEDDRWGIITGFGERCGLAASGSRSSRGRTQGPEPQEYQLHSEVRHTAAGLGSTHRLRARPAPWYQGQPPW